MCQYIIENVDDKNPVNQTFDTPLHLAAQKGNLEVCQLFVNNITDDVGILQILRNSEEENFRNGAGTTLPRMFGVEFSYSMGM